MEKKIAIREAVCAVYDRKSGYYDPPFVARHVADAIRQFDIVRKDNKTKIGAHPEDFVLRHVGFYEFSSGTTENLDPQIDLCEGN